MGETVCKFVSVKLAASCWPWQWSLRGWICTEGRNSGSAFAVDSDLAGSVLKAGSHDQPLL